MSRKETCPFCQKSLSFSNGLNYRQARTLPTSQSIHIRRSLGLSSFMQSATAALTGMWLSLHISLLIIRKSDREIFDPLRHKRANIQTNCYNNNKLTLIIAVIQSQIKVQKLPHPSSITSDKRRRIR